MSKELPFFKFYPSEWIMGRINRESTIDQVAFLRTVCMYWHKDCELLKKELLHYVTNERINSLIKKDYIESSYNEDLEDYNITIKFLDEQRIELGGARQRRVDAGRKGGLKTQAKLKQLEKTKNKKKTKEELINEVVNHPDPNLRLPRELAEKIINSREVKK